MLLQAFRGFTLHINLETLPSQPRPFTPSDQPVFGDRRGPIDLQDCYNAMNGRYDQTKLPPHDLVPDLQTGVDYPLGKEGPR